MQPPTAATAASGTTASSSAGCARNTPSTARPTSTSPEQRLEATMVRLRAVLVLVVFAAGAGAADWPQWLGPKRDGGTPEKVAPWKKGQAPKVVWRAKVGQAYSSPVVAGGRAFVHSRVKGKDE